MKYIRPAIDTAKNHFVFATQATRRKASILFERSAHECHKIYKLTCVIHLHQFGMRRDVYIKIYLLYTIYVLQYRNIYKGITYLYVLQINLYTDILKMHFSK